MQQRSGALGGVDLTLTGMEIFAYADKPPCALCRRLRNGVGEGTAGRVTSSAALCDTGLPHGG